MRNLAGQIVEWFDESNGGYIIKGGQIVNQERYDEEKKKEADRKVAATAQANAISSDSAPPERTAAPGKIDVLEKKVESMEGNITEILKLLKK